MTILFASTDGEAAGPGETLMTVQCDVCIPPFIATMALPSLRSSGWTLTADGASMDVCSVCTRRYTASKLVPRRERYHDAPPVGTLPNLVVVGSAKCGTSSLYRYLDTHPEVSMSWIHEPQFFQDPGCEEWQNYYTSLFDPAVKVTGERSTLYSRAPLIPGVPERMAAMVPDARLIYMVRDPVERAVSSYVEERTHTNELRMFDEAFADLADPYNLHVAASRYAEQLARYTAVFDPAQILVVDMHDLKREPQATLARVFSFLGVDPAAATGDFTVQHNTRDDKREYSPAVRRLRSSPVLKAAYLLPSETREKVLAPARKLLSRPIRRPEISAELRKRLEEELAPDVAELRRVTGQQFASWSI